jgi:hypothetical protein
MHYYGELGILDPTDPEIQDTMRRLRDRPAAAPTQPAEPAEPAEQGAEAPAADAEGDETEDAASAIEAAADEAGEEGAGLEGIEVERHESADTAGVGDIARVEGLESASVEPDPTDAWPSASADLPEWPSAEMTGEVELPGEAEPIDHEAWQQIAAGGTNEPSAEEPSPEEPSTGEASRDEPVAEEVSGAEPDEEEPQPFVAASGEVTVPLNEDHLRFVPPGMFGRPEPEAGAPTDEAVADATEAGSSKGERAEPEGEGTVLPAEDEPEAEGTVSPAQDEPAREIEGRWQTADASRGDVQAERDMPTDHSAEWIPEDRWEWVAASADTSGSAGSPDPDEEQEEESSPESGAGAAPSAWDAETSFAGLADDEDAPAAYGIDDEVSFAGLAEDEGDAILETEPDEEVSFEGIAESGPVDSFEEGAAAVLDAYVRSEDEPEGDDAEAEPAAEPAFVTDRGTGEDDSPVSWVTESEDDGDLVITETLAEIYASQGLYDRAAAVYRRLIDQHPDDDRLHARLADLESATGWAGEPSAGEAEDDRQAFLERVESAWTGGEGAASMEDSPYAWAASEPEEAETGPRAAEYFAGLLAWRPTDAVPSTADEPADAGASPLTEDWYAEESDREPAAGSEEGEVGREGEEDLEMFRSWLKSLKK